MNDDYAQIKYENHMQMAVIDGWIILTGLFNIAANVLIIFGLIKAKLRAPLYMYIINICALNTINQLFCPTIFKVFANTHDIFRDFKNHRVFTSMYFTTLYVEAAGILILLLRNNIKNFVDKFYKYIIGGLWIFVIIVFVVTYLNYTYYFGKYNFIPPYLLQLAVLLVVMHVQRIRKILGIVEYAGTDFQITNLIVSTFIVVKLSAAVLLGIGQLLYGILFFSIDYFIFGLMQLMSLLFVIILKHFEDGFNAVIKTICKRRTVVAGNTFENLTEEHTLPE